ncbi:hypothetical protein HMPREF0514_10325 [Lactobacillus paragasseri JV-V03]|uniref:Uncharacterized protein n=1 Tax=Lactobacillus paragasseri JV-V03 TaxID=525326 RepID=A0AA87A488_9LACO|nr:hypothetical protein [Lactobacillus paragasseri]EFJ69881.1 hypothetical protein HMPREF0514_10325 [Lactobacillus paragasseri JV-V03]
MADIKFMNLSENGNPATTDSVLIGNSQDGMKRTTLGTIGNMFAVHSALHFEEVSVSTATNSSKITDPNVEIGLSYDITAPTISGYTFECWIGSQSNGFIATSYVNSKLNMQSQVWIKAFGRDLTVANNSITATALYIKNELA